MGFSPKGICWPCPAAPEELVEDSSVSSVSFHEEWELSVATFTLSMMELGLQAEGGEGLRMPMGILTPCRYGCDLCWCPGFSAVAVIRYSAHSHLQGLHSFFERSQIPPNLCQKILPSPTPRSHPPPHLP